MECLSHKSEISNTFSSVRNFSFEEKKFSIYNEERMNAFLDAILEFKNTFQMKTEKIIEINESIERVTWFNDLDEESLMLINDLISSIKDLHSTLIRQYVSLNLIRSKGIAKEEIKNFKNTIDDLKENYKDLESVYFFLPEIPDFKETTKLLSLV
jgi:archaellum component FlaC